MKRDFTKLYCFVDDFIKNSEYNSLTIVSCKSKTGVSNYLNKSEVLTILIGFYQSSFDCFKNYYKQQIVAEHRDDFKLVTYEHFTKLIGKCLPYLPILLNSMSTDNYNYRRTTTIITDFSAKKYSRYFTFSTSFCTSFFNNCAAAF